MLKLQKKLGKISGFISAGIGIFNLKHLKVYARQIIYIYSAYSLLHTTSISQNRAKI